ncbi:hypothetical protein FPQ18DRAFT_340918 [Pyronema domesticum]|uniref:Similar to Weak acid resistance protein 1 acc. no. Q03631 n=1 Tax=Pyronema omphalodes (strain CBS 100304) TaxID=1076935 RepID=U4LIU0_PYROM|nr:hypothetical protein FPQ18DRAFT_340918 [Pyronema domesticum]CCX31467.1 Similar to Weak acid resistance protein 1; acc. no. Q03631 [Pyronema omphalodes CBS 100304]
MQNQDQPAPNALPSPASDTPRPSAEPRHAYSQLHPPLLQPSQLHQGPPIGTYPPSSPAQPLQPTVQNSQLHQNAFTRLPLLPHTPSVPPTPSQPTPPTPGAAPSNTLQDKKRSRACESCRSLKVKCEPSDQDGPACRRCTKAKRQCIYTMPTRKRQKKSDTKVAELEAKIDALTNRLNATRQGKQIPSDDEDEDEEMGNTSDTEELRHTPGGSRPHKHRQSDGSGISNTKNGELSHVVRDDVQGFIPAGAKVTIPSGDAPAIPFLEYVDVIDRQLLSMEMAATLFSFYKQNMAPHFPAVVFPPETTAAELRKSKPTLFLAILTAASGKSHPDLRKALQNETVKALAERIMVNSEKSLELVQALLVTSIYYYPPDVYEELSFYVLIHLAASMALDLGMGRRARVIPPNWQLSTNIAAQSHKADTTDPFSSCIQSKEAGGIASPNSLLNIVNNQRPPYRSKSKNPFPDPTTIESRRTLLGCFWTCSNVAVSLRRPNMLKFTNFMRESLEVLETSPLAASSDKNFCQWIRLQIISDELSVAFHLDDPSSDLTIHDPLAQQKILDFSARLQEWYRDIDPIIMTRSLEQNYYLISIYAHEIALHVDHNIEDFRPPFTERLVREPILAPSSPIPNYHLSAIYACVDSACKLLDTFNSFTTSDLSCVPVITFVRVGYACMVLIKVSATAEIKGSRLGEKIRAADLGTERFLEQTLGTMGAAAKVEGNRTAGKFTMILYMMRGWYSKYLTELGEAPEGDERTTRAAEMVTERVQIAAVEHVKEDPLPTPQPAPQTPLQMLAETATYQYQEHPENYTYPQHPQHHHQQYNAFDPIGIAGFVEFQAGDVALNLGGVGGDAVFNEMNFWNMMGPGTWPQTGGGDGWGAF